MIYDVIKKGLKLNMYVLMTLIFLGGIISTGWAYENPPETYTCDDTFEEYDFIEKNDSWTLIIEDGCDSPTIYGSDVHLVYNKSTTKEEFVFERQAVSRNNSGELQRLYEQDLPDNTHASTYFHYFDDVSIEAELFNGTYPDDTTDISDRPSGVHHLNFENSNHINRIDINTFVDDQHLYLESLKSIEKSNFKNIGDSDTFSNPFFNIIGESTYELFIEEEGGRDYYLYNEVLGFDNVINNSNIILNFHKNTTQKYLNLQTSGIVKPKMYNSNFTVLNDGGTFYIQNLFYEQFLEFINNNFYFENSQWEVMETNIQSSNDVVNIDNFYLNTFEFKDSEFNNLIGDNYGDELQIYNNDTGIPIGNRYIVDGDDYYSCDTTTSSQTINNVNYISCDEGVSVGDQVDDYIITDSYSATSFQSDERTGQFIANVMSGIGIGLGNLMVSISTPALVIVWVIAIAGSIVTIVYTVTSLITRRGRK